jgi:hypothetical protein
MGGDLHMFVSEHAAILIFGGCTAATLLLDHARRAARRQIRVFDAPHDPA